MKKTVEERGVFLNKGKAVWNVSQEKALLGFLQDLIQIPSYSSQEEQVIKRIQQEMEMLNYDEVKIDDMGNILGRIGSGEKVIVFDGHIDTVETGLLENWTKAPYSGEEDHQYIYGRGASDQKAGFAAAVHGAAWAKTQGNLEGVTLWVTGTVQEEDCDGLCWQYILDEKLISPDFVVITEPTNLKIHRGQRGRMEIQVKTKGISAHGSAPERGENAIYKMAEILSELESLNHRLTVDPFLGKGSLTVSEIFYTSPSRCAVADGCQISIDRRLTQGETKETAIQEIQQLPSVIKHQPEISLYTYDKASYTGLQKKVDCYFPTWVIEETHPYIDIVKKAYEEVTHQKPVLDKWTFSTNGVSIMGLYGIPCVGFGPGLEEEAHAPNEKVLKEQVITASLVYSKIPQIYGGQG